MPPMPPPPKRSQLSQVKGEVGDDSNTQQRGDSTSSWKAPEVGELEAASEEVSDCWSWKLMIEFFGYQQDWKDSLRNVLI